MMALDGLLDTAVPGASEVCIGSSAETLAKMRFGRIGVGRSILIFRRAAGPRMAVANQVLAVGGRR